MAPVLNALAALGLPSEGLTLPGHAAFDPLDNALACASISSYRSYVVEEVRRRAETKRVILVGHSMGGVLSLMAAEEGLVHALVLLAPAAPAGVGNLAWSVWPLVKEATFHQMKSGLRPWSRPYVPSADVARWMFASGLAETAQDTIIGGLVGESLRAMSENLSPLAVAWLTLSPRTPNPRLVNFAAIQCPVLIVFGDNDKIAPPKISRAIRQRLPFNALSDAIEIPGACHWISAEPRWLVGEAGQPSLSTRIVDWIGSTL